MKVSQLDLQYFKRFREASFDFRDEAGYPKNLVVLIGPNGAGKTSILQAIALAVGKATNVLRDVQDLDWPGFDPDLAHASWRIPGNTTSIECKVVFGDDELAATQEYYQLTPFASEPDGVPPGNERIATLQYYPNGVVRAGSAAELFQFRGYDYAKQIVQSHPNRYGVFERVGRVVWYTQNRMATSLRDWGNGSGGFDLNALRTRLAGWQNYSLRLERDGETRPGQRDIYARLRETYKRVFPDRDFVGTEARGPEDILEASWFLLSHGNLQYEISEMSAGEQAIFPILFDFVTWNINHSIVLIDEVGLHLHPPLQQAFVRSLPLLGENNQFIITTHSEDVLASVPDDSVIRIEEQ